MEEQLFVLKYLLKLLDSRLSKNFINKELED